MLPMSFSHPSQRHTVTCSPCSSSSRGVPGTEPEVSEETSETAMDSGECGASSVASSSIAPSPLKAVEAVRLTGRMDSAGGEGEAEKLDSSDEAGEEAIFDFV